MKMVKGFGLTALVMGMFTLAAYATTPTTPATTTPSLGTSCKVQCPEAKDNASIMKCIANLDKGANAVTFKQTECYKTHAAMMNAKTTAQPTTPAAPAAVPATGATPAPKK